MPETPREESRPFVALEICSACGQHSYSLWDEGCEDYPFTTAECSACGSLRGVMMGPPLFTLN
jgi:hypothetical protein